MFQCKFCNKIFNTERALGGHMRLHGKSEGRIHTIFCCCIFTRREIKVSSLEKFQRNIKFCRHCNKPIGYYKKFCSQSCAASFNNIERIKNGFVVNESHRNKTSQSVKHTLLSKGYVPKPKPKPKKLLNQHKYIDNSKGEFTKIFLCNCPHCKSKFVCKRKTKYCKECGPLYDVSYRDRFKFTFNVYCFPDLFNISKISSIGWYSRGGLAGKWNPNGLSRDHKISVTEAIRNNYSPFYITHPLNCEIMTWLENNKKKGKSSISYDELVTEVNEYERSKAGRAEIESASS